MKCPFTASSSPSDTHHPERYPVSLKANVWRRGDDTSGARSSPVGAYAIKANTAFAVELASDGF